MGRSKVWFEVEDIVRFLEAGRQPTGIQRVALEIIAQSFQLFPERVGLCRIDQTFSTIRPYPFQWPFDRSSGPRLAARTPPNWLVGVGHLVSTAFLAIPNARSFAALVRPGDVIVTLGSPWWPNKRHTKSIGKFAERYGLRYALFIHDLIPLVHPEFVEGSGHIAVFRRWFLQAIAVADMVFVSSSYSALQLQNYLGSHAIGCPPLVQIGFGSDFDAVKTSNAADLPALSDGYVLFVSTLEIRKNHRLLVRIWRKLLAMHRRDSIPDLVFVGRQGWMIDDLLTELHKSNFLDGKIIWLQDITDQQLSAIYTNCSFTVFPSFTEGWGLPVGESLRHGKPCLASCRGSMPEVGGDFCLYFDPDDFLFAYKLVERAIFDADFLSQLTEKLRGMYKPSSWKDTAMSLVAALDR